MKIIGHRGAAGLAFENSLEAIKVARRVGVDAIEMDIQLTSDKKFIVCHDPTTERVTGSPHIICRETLRTLRQLRLHNGEQMLTLSTAINAAENTKLCIEAKGDNWAPALADQLKNKQLLHLITVLSFNHAELRNFHKYIPNIPTFAIISTHPRNGIQLAHAAEFTGINIKFWRLTPLIYWQANRLNLDIMVYTVNSRIIARVLKAAYPTISITTNYPDRLQFLRSKNP